MAQPARCSTARTTLAKARFFIDRAEEVTAEQRDAFSNYLEAAIVFARSITFHVQKEFSSHPAFDVWYAEQQQKLRDNPLAKFLLEQRNYVLKQGPVPVKRVVDVSLTASVSASALLTVKVIRGKPWYRRSPRVLFEDATYPVRASIHKFKEKRATRVRAAQHERSSATLVRDNIFFDAPQWESTPAIELIRRQLEGLESMVSDAERLFSGGGGKNAA